MKLPSQLNAILLASMEGNCEYCGDDFKQALDTGAEVWERDSERGYFLAVTEAQRWAHHRYLADGGWSRY